MADAAWPTTADLLRRLNVPHNGGDDTDAAEAVAAAVTWISGRTGLAEDAEVPANVRLGTLMYAHKFYLRKNSPDGVAGSNAVGQIRVSGFDPDAERLIAPWCAVPHA